VILALLAPLSHLVRAIPSLSVLAIPLSFSFSVHTPLSLPQLPRSSLSLSSHTPLSLSSHAPLPISVSLPRARTPLSHTQYSRLLPPPLSVRTLLTQFSCSPPSLSSRDPVHLLHSVLALLFLALSYTTHTYTVRLSFSHSILALPSPSLARVRLSLSSRAPTSLSRVRLLLSSRAPPPLFHFVRSPLS